jgi:hypothetical protein
MSLCWILLKWQPRWSLWESYGFNLHICVLGERLDGDTAAGRLVGHPLLVLLVHLGEVTHVGQEDVDLDDFLDRSSGLLKNGLQVLEAQCCLLSNGTLNQVPLSVEMNLTRAVDCGRRLDSMRLDIGMSGTLLALNFNNHSRKGQRLEFR